MANTSGFSSQMDGFYDKLSKLSKIQRIVIFVLTLVALVGAFAFFLYMPLKDDLASLTKKRDNLKKTLVSHKKKAAQYPKYKAMMEKAMADFAVAMNKLPEKKDIPVLLASISAAAQDAGLGIQLFQPQTTSSKQFYEVIPVAIKVVGSYHQTASFFDNVSRLSRIVNIKNISISPGNVSCTAVTYKFIEPKDDKTTSKKGRRKK